MKLDQEAYEFIKGRIAHHSHDLGEFGQVIKLPYIDEILDEVKLHQEAMGERHEIGDPIDAHRDLTKAARELAHAWDQPKPEVYYAAIDNLEKKLRELRHLEQVQRAE